MIFDLKDGSAKFPRTHHTASSQGSK